MTRSIAQIGLQSVAAAIATARIAVSCSAGSSGVCRAPRAIKRTDLSGLGSPFQTISRLLGRFEASRNVSGTGAHERVLKRIEQMGDRFSVMSGPEFAAWVDALPRAEFLAYMLVSIPLRDG